MHSKTMSHLLFCVNPAQNYRVPHFLPRLAPFRFQSAERFWHHHLRPDPFFFFLQSTTRLLSTNETRQMSGKKKNQDTLFLVDC